MARGGRRWRGEKGQGQVEYALLLVVASLGIGLALLILRDSIGGGIETASGQINAATEASKISPAGSSGVQPSGGNDGTPAGPAGDDGGQPGGRGYHGNGKGNSGNGKGNGGSNGRKH